MKFVRLFFLLVIILVVNVIASAKVSSFKSYRPVIDTIIKLDSVKDRKLLKGKKSTSNKGGKTAAGKTDTTKKQSGGLKSIVTAHAEDSTRYDDVHQVLYLYGRARVTYEDFELDADYIRVDEKNKIIFASGQIDPLTKRYIGRPISKQGKDKPVTSDSLRFHYETKKGKIYNASSDQDGNFITGGQAKKLNETEVAYRNIIFSTCDLPYPDTHFGIVITKGIGEKNRIVSGPAFLEIEGVPLPLAIPFGFFPKPDSRTSGVILPTFGEDQKLGFYLRNFGYYIALNDYIDLTNMGTFYSKGSYEVSTSARYLSRYKYSGTVTLSYSSTNYGLPGDPPTKDFHIDWSHSQNPNSNPGTTFSASVNAGTSGFFKNNPATQGYNLNTLTSSSLRSSIAYGRVWEGTPFNLTVNLSHSQDLVNKTVTLELPTFNFNMSTISPFDSKERVGTQKWYQKITVGYSVQGTNKINAVPESELFTSETFTKRLQNGIEHQIPIGFNQNILKYFQFSANVNYQEWWYFQTVRESFARGSVPGRDSLTFDTVGGFKRAGQYTVGASLSTKIYSTLSFKNSSIKAIRYVATPSLSFSYHPDFSNLNYGYYQTAVSNATIPYQISYQKYSIFQNAVYGGPSAGKTAGVGISIDNNIEAKVRPKSTDTSTTDKKIKILEGFNISTFYNFAADSLKLSAISFSGHTSLFKQKLNITIGGSLDPYVTQVRDSIMSNQIFKYKVPTNRYTWQDGKFPTLTSFNLSASASLNPALFKPQNTTTPTPANTLQTMNPDQAAKLALLNSDPSAYVDFNVPWNVSLNYSFNYNNGYTSTFVTNTIQLSGDVNVTPKWKVQYTTNYDLRAGRLSSATSFGIYRDLHCWDLSVQWLPFGYYKSYNVTLRVKAAILQDLKLTKRSDYTSNQFYSPN
ncbi:putative LPS assembly protein LptD [Mucilaginibacter sp. McL0603]|uniref:putative LPS assembly protein LptD n=1 Tax=Mucilaginibacter sp. McL0603 TaxID=3415670 RepID=UPI003CEA7723